MSEFQILGFANGGPSVEDQPFGVSTTMNNNVMTLPSYIPPINFLTYYVFEFESHTSSTSPYIVIIKKDGVEVVRSLSITSGNLETTVLDFHDIDDDSGYTAHLEFCGDITFELLRFVFTQNSKSSQFDPTFSQVFEQDYPSTNLIHTDPCDDGTGGNEGNQVSSTGNYRQQTTSNLGATTSCPTCGLPSILASTQTPTNVCQTPQATAIYFEVVPPATNTFPVVGNNVFTDSSGLNPLNNTSTIYYYVSSTTALGVQNGVVVSSAACVSGSSNTSFFATAGTSSLNDGKCGSLCDTLLYHNGTGTLPQTGDTIYSGSTTGSSTVTWSDHRGFGDFDGDSAYVTGRVDASGVILSTWQCV